MDLFITKKIRKKALINIIIYFMSISFGVSLLYLLFSRISNVNDINLLFEKYQALLMLIILFFVSAVVITINMENLSEFCKSKFLSASTFKSAIYIFIIYVISMIVLGKILSLVVPDLGDTENNEAVARMFTGKSSFIAYFTVLLLAPITEELIFRYSFTNLFYINNKKFLWVTYVISAVFFALIHEYSFLFDFSIANVAQFLKYFIPSLILSFGYMLSKNNLIAVIYAHMIINTLATASIWLM